ncbi:protein TolQ [Elioraea rosea]|uniref:protein TolQ n=1 Tax=Elioraea rosea TaxID=2492390 RepID=UPI001184620C|nr:protein TolQ [Elioraea rosea]
MDRAVEAAGLAGDAAASLSLWSLFLQADIVVKAVMIGLLLASVWVWAIIFDKTVTLRRANARAAAFEDRFWSGVNLEDLYREAGENPRHPMEAVFSAAMREWNRSASRLVSASEGSRVAIRERVERAMAITTQREMERLEKWMVFLASVGSAAPFIGLFGTVWGIMNSFTAIAAMKNTNLTVVAPGIAEALFATAIGLVAAIPAVLAYNKISTDLARFAARLEGFAGEFGAILSRQTDERV